MSNHKSKTCYTICLEDFVVEAIIGILPNERQATQRILVDAEFTYIGNPQTQSSRNLDATESREFLDYRILRDFIKESFGHQFGLLEEAQEYFCREIPLRFPQIKEFWIKITKLEIFDDCNISIRINYQK